MRRWFVAMAKDVFQIDGAKELKKSLDRLGKLPTKCVTKAVRKGGNAIMKAVKARAPVDTGMLKAAIKLKVEKSKTRGKRVAQITYSADYNDVLVKTSANGNRSYYPASQEYGYMTRDGGYVPGYHFMQKSAESTDSTAKGLIMETLIKEVDKEWAKNGG